MKTNEPEVEPAFRAIADCTYDWETWVGPDGRTRWVNPAVARMTGWTPQECLELADYPLPLVYAEDRERVREALRCAAQGIPGNDLEFRMLHRSGEIKWAAMSWQSLTMVDGQRLGYRTSVREITARKRLEVQLREALERARVAERSRAAFLANVSHELRTPLNNLLGHVELLRAVALDPAGLAHVQVIEDQAAVLLRLVDDLLHVAADDVRRTPRPRQSFAPLPLLERCIEAHRPAIEGAGLALRVETSLSPDDTIEGDAATLGHILRNLLDNAQKYTPQGNVHVRSRIEGQTDRWLVIDIEDTGRGMAPEHIDELRQPLVRGEQPGDTHVPGVGLGLAIVDRLCNELGGRLTIQSAPGKGTRVSVRLPTHATTEPAAEVLEDFAWEQLRVLVVDDNATGRDLTVTLLLRLGCRVESAASGREALDHAAQSPFDLVLMDLHMPGLDGETTARLLRAQRPTHGEVPRVVALTADVFAAAEASLRGFDGRITKPIDTRELQRILLAMARTGAEEPRLEQLVDPRRLQELRSMRTSDGETFFARFAPRVIADLRDLARTMDHDLTATGGSLFELAHRMRNAANIVGASDLAREAGDLQELAERGEEPWAAIASVTEQARRVATALERLLG